VKHRFIEEHGQRYGVKVLCGVLQVSRSGYYAAPGAECTLVTASDADRAHSRDPRASRETYGAPRIHAELQAQGRVVLPQYDSQADAPGADRAPQCPAVPYHDRLAQHAGVGRLGAAAVRGAAAEPVLPPRRFWFKQSYNINLQPDPCRLRLLRDECLCREPAPTGFGCERRITLVLLITT